MRLVEAVALLPKVGEAGKDTFGHGLAEGIEGVRAGGRGGSAHNAKRFVARAWAQLFAAGEAERQRRGQVRAEQLGSPHTKQPVEVEGGRERAAKAAGPVVGEGMCTPGRSQRAIRAMRVSMWLGGSPMMSVS